jgi:hypothetical protein
MQTTEVDIRDGLRPAVQIPYKIAINMRRWDAAALSLRGRPLDVLMGVAL